MVIWIYGRTHSKHHLYGAHLLCLGLPLDELELDQLQKFATGKGHKVENLINSVSQLAR